MLDNLKKRFVISVTISLDMGALYGQNGHFKILDHTNKIYINIFINLKCWSTKNIFIKVLT